MEQSKAISRLAMKLNTKYVLAGIALCYMVLSFSLMNRRDFIEWQVVFPQKIWNSLASLFFGLTLYCVVVLVLARVFPKLTIILNKICSKRIIYLGSLTVLFISLVLTFMHIPGLWWTWTSFGVQICTILLAYIILEGKVQPYEAVIAGIACSGVAIGIWEIPYQWGMALTNYSIGLTPSQVQQKIIYETQLQLPLIIGGIGALYIVNKKYRIMRFGRWFWAFLLATMGLYVYWFMSGFHTDMGYDWATQQYISNPVNIVAKIVSRGSKITLVLSLLSLLSTKSLHQAGVNK